MNIKKMVPLLIAFITGLVYVAAKFIPREPFSEIKEDFAVWFNIMAAVAFIIGGGNLIRMNVTKIYRRKEGWGFSVVCLLSFMVMLTAGLLKIGNPDGWAGDVTIPESLAGYLYNYVFSPLISALFALLAFFVASASFRAFRAKNKEATILLISAFIILLGRTFLGTLLTSFLPESLSFLKIPNLFNWIMSVPNTAGQRAIMIGIALGIVSTSIKLILGIESSYLGMKEKDKGAPNEIN